MVYKARQTQKLQYNFGSDASATSSDDSDGNDLMDHHEVRTTQHTRLRLRLRLSASASPPPPRLRLSASASASPPPPPPLRLCLRLRLRFAALYY